jgi:hypothetical protein
MIRLILRFQRVIEISWLKLEALPVAGVKSRVLQNLPKKQKQEIKSKKKILVI